MVVFALSSISVYSLVACISVEARRVWVEERAVLRANFHLDQRSFLRIMRLGFPKKVDAEIKALPEHCVHLLVNLKVHPHAISRLSSWLPVVTRKATMFSREWCYLPTWVACQATSGTMRRSTL